MNHAAMLVAASSRPPSIVTSSAQALIPAMAGALAFIVAAAVTILALFMQSDKSKPYVQVPCALGIVYLLVASFCSLRDAIYALTTRPPETLPALRGVSLDDPIPSTLRPCGHRRGSMRNDGPVRPQLGKRTSQL